MPNELPNLTKQVRQSLIPGISDDLIRKQLIHAAIVKALDGCGALDLLTMQGGSCIAGCYGGLRLSEDLDFEMDDLPTTELSEDMAQAIENTVRAVFNANVHVKRPAEKKLTNPSGTVAVAKWLTKVEVEVEERRPDIPRAVVKLKIAKVPHQTSVARRFSNIASKRAGFRDSIVLAEDIEELLADKVVSLLAQEKILRVRDVWDMAHLMRVRPIDRAKVRELVDIKIDAYGLDGQHLRERIGTLEQADWTALIAGQLAPMMVAPEAAQEASSPRSVAALAAEVFELIKYTFL